MAFGIMAWGAYIPRLRLERAAIAATHAWMAPSLKGLAQGRRAYCSWDEDVVTMAVEAARECLGRRDRAKICEIDLASTTAPSADLQSSAIVAVALRLQRTVRALDFGGSQRADTSAAVNMDSLGHRPQDLFVPDGRRHLEIAVANADDRWAGECCLIELALPERRVPFKRWIGGPGGWGQRRAGENDGPGRGIHPDSAAARRARTPGV